MENNSDTFSSGWWEENDTICYFEETETLEQKNAYGITFKCNVKGWLTELAVTLLR